VSRQDTPRLYVSTCANGDEDRVIFGNYHTYLKDAHILKLSCWLDHGSKLHFRRGRACHPDMKRIDLFLKSSVDTEKFFPHLSEAAFLEEKSQRPKRNLKVTSAVERIPGTLLSRTENFFFLPDGTLKPTAPKMRNPKWGHKEDVRVRTHEGSTNKTANSRTNSLIHPTLFFCYLPAS
jgi:hypothetical protein